MSLSVARFLALRYIFKTNNAYKTNIVSVISFISIALSTFCLTLQLCVSDGFDKALTEKMRSIYPQLIIEAPLDESFDVAFMQKKLKEFCPSINGIAPAHTKQVIIKPVDQDTPSVITLKAVDPLQEPYVSSIEKKLQTTDSLTKVLAENHIIIGSKLADFYDLKVGDQCTLIFTDDPHLCHETKNFESTTLTIGAIMHTGIIHFDKYSALCSLETMNEYLNDPDITCLGISFCNQTNEEKEADKIIETFNLETYSWKTLYPALVSATKLEKYVMALLLMLMILISSGTIMALLFMHITSKKKDIALLKTVGMPEQSIVYLFTFMGTFLVTFSGATGILFGLLVGVILQKYPFITLPDAYFSSHLPVYISWQTPVIVIGTTIAIGIICSWFCARTIKNINITHVLRFEG